MKYLSKLLILPFFTVLIGCNDSSKEGEEAPTPKTLYNINWKLRTVDLLVTVKQDNKIITIKDVTYKNDTTYYFFNKTNLGDIKYNNKSHAAFSFVYENNSITINQNNEIKHYIIKIFRSNALIITRNYKNNSYEYSETYSFTTH